MTKTAAKPETDESKPDMPNPDKSKPTQRLDEARMPTMPYEERNELFLRTVEGAITGMMTGHFRGVNTESEAKKFLDVNNAKQGDLIRLFANAAVNMARAVVAEASKSAG